VVAERKKIVPDGTSYTFFFYLCTLQTVWRTLLTVRKIVSQAMNSGSIPLCATTSASDDFVISVFAEIELLA